MIKTLKNIGIFLLSLLLGTALGYCLVAFSQWELNPEYWKDEIRNYLVVGVMVFTIALTNYLK